MSKRYIQDSKGQKYKSISPISGGVKTYFLILKKLNELGKSS